MNIIGKLILGCFQTDSRDNMPSIEALAMVGADHGIVQAPFIDQPCLVKVVKFFERLWPFRINNNMGDYESSSEETEYSQNKATEPDFFDWSEVFLANERTKSHARDIISGL